MHNFSQTVSYLKLPNINVEEGHSEGVADKGKAKVGKASPQLEHRNLPKSIFVGRGEGEDRGKRKGSKEGGGGGFRENIGIDKVEKSQSLVTGGITTRCIAITIAITNLSLILNHV